MKDIFSAEIIALCSLMVPSNNGYNDKNNKLYNIEWDVLLDLAEKNKLQFHTCLRIQDINEAVPNAVRKRIQDIVTDKKNKFKINLAVLKSVLDVLDKFEIPSMVIKTFPYYPQESPDIDLLIVGRSNWRKAIRLLLGQGRVVRRLKFENSKVLVSPNIHLHSSISWNDVQYLSISDVWKRHRTELIDGVTVAVPSIEDEILIAAAHSIFETNKINLGEIVNLNFLFEKKPSWEYLHEASRKYGWFNALYFFIKALSTLNEIFYNHSNYLEWLEEYSKYNSRIMEKISYIPVKNSLPYDLPFLPLLSLRLSKIHTNLRNRGNFTLLIKDCHAYTLDVFSHFRDLTFFWD